MPALWCHLACKTRPWDAAVQASGLKAEDSGQHTLPGTHNTLVRHSTLYHSLPSVARTESILILTTQLKPGTASLQSHTSNRLTSTSLVCQQLHTNTPVAVTALACGIAPTARNRGMSPQTVSSLPYPATLLPAATDPTQRATALAAVSAPDNAAT